MNYKVVFLNSGTIPVEASNVDEAFDLAADIHREELGQKLRDCHKVIIIDENGKVHETLVGKGNKPSLGEFLKIIKGQMWF